jgi:hypothetical protein
VYSVCAQMLDFVHLFFGVVSSMLNDAFPVREIPLHRLISCLCLYL